jgi:hypothetical protein
MNMMIDLSIVDLNEVNGISLNQAKVFKAEINNDFAHAIEIATKAFGDLIKGLKNFPVISNGVAYTTD